MACQQNNKARTPSDIKTDARNIELVSDHEWVSILSHLEEIRRVYRESFLRLRRIARSLSTLNLRHWPVTRGTRASVRGVTCDNGAAWLSAVAGDVDVNCHDTAKVLTNLMSYFVVIMQPYKRSRNPSTPLTWIHPSCKRNTKCTASSMNSRAPGLNWVPIVPWPLVSGRLSGTLAPTSPLLTAESREWPQQSEITLNTPATVNCFTVVLKFDIAR